MAYVNVVLIGDKPVLAKLMRRQAPAINVTMQKAIRASAAVTKPVIAAQAPKRTGLLRKSVSVRTNRQFAFGEAAGVNVGPRIWRRHFVIGGTRRGIEPNPFVVRGARMAQPAARAAFQRVIQLGIR
jgi:hypothetical protein